jgi:hypothetical protein
MHKSPQIYPELSYVLGCYIDGEREKADEMAMVALLSLHRPRRPRVGGGDEL